MLVIFKEARISRRPNIRCRTFISKILSLVRNNENDDDKEIRLANGQEGHSSRRRGESCAFNTTIVC